jgi:hypothetical protein
MVEVGEPAATIWPYRANRSEIATALQSLGISPTPLSPLAARLSSAVDGNSTTLPEIVIQRPLLRALVGVADPERLILLVARGADGTLVASFLAGSAGIVGYDLHGETLEVSAPMSPAEFGAEVGRLVGAPMQDDGPADVVTVRFLRTLAALLRKATRAGMEHRISRDDASTAVRTELPNHEMAADALAALQEDGVLRATDDAFFLGSAWSQRFGYLLDAERIDLISIELEDAQASVWAPREIVVLGAAGRQRITALPARGLDQPLRLFPFDRARLRAAAIALASPPWTPASTPRATDRVDFATWLDDPITDAWPDWATSSQDDLTAAARRSRDGAAAAIMRPSATVETVVRRIGDQQGRRGVIAFSTTAAGQWEMVGSRIRWRPLPPGGLADHLHRLTPLGQPSPSATSSVDLTPGQVAAIATGRLDPAEQLPIELHTLAADETAEWCAIRLLIAQPRAVAGVSLQFAMGGGGVWRFDETDTGAQASAVSTADLRSDLLAVLTS